MFVYSACHVVCMPEMMYNLGNLTRIASVNDDLQTDIAYNGYSS